MHSGKIMKEMTRAERNEDFSDYIQWKNGNPFRMKCLISPCILSYFLPKPFAEHLLYLLYIVPDLGNILVNKI